MPILQSLRERLTRSRRRRMRGAEAYAEAVRLARDPAWYAAHGVPDTIEARFELITIHVVLLARRLQREAGDGPAVAQAMIDAFFTDIDRNLREMGVGDLSVGRKVKDIAGAFVARARDLSAALDARDRTALVTVLARNLDLPGAAPPTSVAEVLADYALAFECRAPEAQSVPSVTTRSR